MLLAAAVFGALAAIFALIGVATPGWPSSDVSYRIQLFNCGGLCKYSYTAAGVLLIIAIVILVISSVIIILFLRKFISNPTDRMKGPLFFFLIIAGVFIVSSYSRAVDGVYYSYHLSVSAGIMTFFSAIFFTYWVGRNSVSPVA